MREEERRKVSASPSPPSISLPFLCPFRGRKRRYKKCHFLFRRQLRWFCFAAEEEEEEEEEGRDNPAFPGLIATVIASSLTKKEINTFDTNRHFGGTRIYVGFLHFVYRKSYCSIYCTVNPITKGSRVAKSILPRGERQVSDCYSSYTFPPAQEFAEGNNFLFFFFSRKYRKFKRRSWGSPVEKEIGRVIFKQEREGGKMSPRDFF